MKDCTKYLAKALVAAIKTKTGLPCWTKVPKGDDGNPTAIPYIYISGISNNEDGPKCAFHYVYSLNIEIVYAGLYDKLTLWNTVDEVKNIFSERVPFLLEGNFEIMTTRLVSGSEREDLFGSIDVDVATLVIEFLIEDNN